MDGSTTPKERDAAIARFQTDPVCRVFVGQIAACCEAIDLSAASTLWFVESSFTPAQMGQAAMRITNVGRKRNCFVKVLTLEGTIDEALQAALMRLWATIKEVVK